MNNTIMSNGSDFNVIVPDEAIRGRVGYQSIRSVAIVSVKNGTEAHRQAIKDKAGFVEVDLESRLKGVAESLGTDVDSLAALLDEAGGDMPCHGMKVEAVMAAVEAQSQAEDGIVRILLEKGQEFEVDLIEPLMARMAECGADPDLAVQVGEVDADSGVSPDALAAEVNESLLEMLEEDFDEDGDGEEGDHE